MPNRIWLYCYRYININNYIMRKPNMTKAALFWTVGLLIALLLLSCEKQPEYVCFDTFQGEEVIIEGVEVTIYNKVIVCEDVYYY